MGPEQMESSSNRGAGLKKQYRREQSTMKRPARIARTVTATQRGKSLLLLSVREKPLEAAADVLEAPALLVEDVEVFDCDEEDAEDVGEAVEDEVVAWLVVGAEDDADDEVLDDGRVDIVLTAAVELALL